MADPYKILIADDVEDNLGTLREWLSSQDYHVRCARDGREALEIARNDPPDLILLDKVMPEVDGLTVARQLKREDRFSTVPIIVLTGRDDTRRHSIFDDGDADDLIMKPLDYEEVETRVRTMLKKRDVFRDLERANEELRLANERMSRLVQFDEKTHLHNYRHFMQRLEEEFKRVKRYGPNLTLVMFDLDHFKSVNDRFGHVAGDRVLVGFGRIMSRTARETDIIARYGERSSPSCCPTPRRPRGNGSPNGSGNRPRCSIFPTRPAKAGFRSPCRPAWRPSRSTIGSCLRNICWLPPTTPSIAPRRPDATERTSMSDRWRV